jgi:hypothetical protein
MDKHENQIAAEGCDRCFCGCKYWEADRCIDCGTHILSVLNAEQPRLFGDLSGV